MDKKDPRREVFDNASNSPEAIAKRLRRVRNLANLSRQEICNTGDLNINTYKGWELARFGGLTQEGAEKVLARLFLAGVVCSSEWLLSGSGATPYLLEIDKSLSKFSLSNDKQSEKNHILNELMIFQETHNDSVFIEITDDCMLPFYEKGDFIAGIKISNTCIDKAIDTNCIIKIKNGLTVARYLRKSLIENHFYLIPLNSKSNAPLGIEAEIDFVATISRHYKNMQ